MKPDPTWSPSISMLRDDKSDGMDIVVFAIIVIILVIIVMLVCNIGGGCCSEDKSDKFEPPVSKSTEQLIPPIFYTDNLLDPLKQEDLHERIRTN